MLLENDMQDNEEGLEIQEISSFSEFLTLETAWNQLVKENAEDACFLSHEWFRCCIEHYGAHKSLCILAFWRFGILEGIAPLWVVSDVWRKIPIRKIEFIASRDTPYVNLLVRSPNHRMMVLQVILYLKVEFKKKWDVLVLQQLPMQSPDYLVVREILKEQGSWLTEWESSTTPFVPIQGTWEDFLQSKSVRIRKTYRNVWNRVHKLEGFQIECLRYQLHEDTMAQLFSVSENGWKYLEGKSLANGQSNKGFFEALTQASLRKGWLLLWFLKVKEIPIAMEYDLVSEEKVFALRSDFDERHKENSPGAFLEAWILRWLFQNGFQEYNYGPGLNQYKLHWATQFKKNMCVCLFNQSFKGRLLSLIEVILKPFVKKSMQRVRGSFAAHVNQEASLE